MMLVSFALFGLLDLSLVLYLFVFFILTYLTIGSAMMAVGSAVNEMREAQSLMMPIILVMMVPWVLAEPIARLDVRHRHLLRPAGEHFRHAAQADVERAAARVAGMADHRDRRRGGRRLDLVRGENLHDRPADVRKAARLEDPSPLDSQGLARFHYLVAQPFKAAHAAKPCATCWVREA